MLDEHDQEPRSDLPPPQDHAEQGGVRRAIKRAKKHPVVVVATTVVALIGFVFTVWDQGIRIKQAKSDVEHPYDVLKEVRLGAGPDLLAEKFGATVFDVDLCKSGRLECPRKGTTS